MISLYFIGIYISTIEHYLVKSMPDQHTANLCVHTHNVDARERPVVLEALAVPQRTQLVSSALETCRTTLSSYSFR